MTTKQTTTRRTFLKTAAVATGAMALPMYVPASAFGANDRIVTGHIGVGKMGNGNLTKHLSHAAAVCDVDKNHLAKAMKRVEKKGKHKCKGYSDYRKLLEQKDIDGVIVTTPDHWHALITIAACRAGKDVYCEKPLSLTIDEGRKMVEVARKEKQIVQTGSMQRSASQFRLACELVRSGRIGKLKEVRAGIAGVNHPGKLGPNTDAPAELDYDFWLGPAAKRPYNEKRVHYNFRFWWDYSGGQMTNWGAHYIDIAQWGMGMDNSGPISIVADRVEYHPEKFHEVTEKCRVTCTYANGVKLIVGQRQKDIPTGTTFIGEKGKIFVNRRKIVSTPGGIAKEPLKKDDVHLYVSNNHHTDWMNCMKSRKLPICDVEIGHRSATVCHLANIACRLGRKITWDPKKEVIVGDEKADQMRSRPYRGSWTLG